MNVKGNNFRRLSFTFYLFSKSFWCLTAPLIFVVADITLLFFFRSVVLFLEDLHSLPVGQMGNYQDYVKGLEAIGRGPLREVEPQAIRVHAFGNPFKIDKVFISVEFLYG